MEERAFWCESACAAEEPGNGIENDRGNDRGNSKTGTPKRRSIPRLTPEDAIGIIVSTSDSNPT